MMLKALYGVSLGLVAFMLLILAPSGSGFVSSASPDKVERKAPTGPSTSGSGNRSRSRNRSRGPRYVWASGYRGK
jgi:hypothetical protein